MNSERYYWVYVLASGIGGTLYVGVTQDLVRRGYGHRENAVGGFTRKYGVHRLVYYEPHTDITEAIWREKRLKKWNRAWKIRLIEERNPHWDDLYPAISSP
jgi:putative endonuclease